MKLDNKKLLVENIVLIIKIGIPSFFINIFIWRVIFYNSINFKNAIGLSFIISLWLFYNIIMIFDINFHGSGLNLSTNSFEYTKKDKKNSLKSKILFFIISTTVIGYIVTKIILE